FVTCFCIILSMYGGGFATVPAYLADMFGTQFVGAIHGRLLTAWSTAGIIGPVVVNYLREFQLKAGVPRDQLYNSTMYVLCAMLVIGLICNLLVRPVNRKWYMSADEVQKLQAASARSAAMTEPGSFGIGKGGLSVGAVVFWAFVGIPLAWGVWTCGAPAGGGGGVAPAAPRPALFSAGGPGVRRTHPPKNPAAAPRGGGVAVFGGRPGRARRWPAASRPPRNPRPGSAPIWRSS